MQIVRSFGCPQKPHTQDVHRNNLIYQETCLGNADFDESCACNPKARVVSSGPYQVKLNHTTMLLLHGSYYTLVSCLKKARGQGSSNVFFLVNKAIQ